MSSEGLDQPEGALVLLIQCKCCDSNLFRRVLIRLYIVGFCVLFNGQTDFILFYFSIRGKV